MSELFAPVCSIAPTRRRRFLWAAWWSGPPTRTPFSPPDAWSGGARTREEAKLAAEHAAGQPLVEIEPRWARAHARTLLGQPPWAEPQGAGSDHARSARTSTGAHARPWSEILGIAASSSAEEIKAAYRRRALETHPDRGGDAAEFRAVQRAYEQAQRPRKRRRR